MEPTQEPRKPDEVFTCGDLTVEVLYDPEGPTLEELLLPYLTEEL